jgi:phosphoribosylformylglycinamidine synthase
MTPQVLIIHASGTNRDLDTAEAVQLAGGAATIRHLRDLRKHPTDLRNYQMLIVAGGFSFGDALGAGKRLALELAGLRQALTDFVAADKPVLGICNGFQALLQTGLLASANDALHLSSNQRSRFECRWVYLKANPDSHCVFTRHLPGLIYCPVAHGEGRLISERHISAERIAVQYCFEDGQLAQGHYPTNPNGSVQDIAGLCNAKGNVLGLMPHPENHIYDWQHPNWRRGTTGQLGLALIRAGLDYAKTIP